MNREELEKLSKEELIDLVLEQDANLMKLFKEFLQEHPEGIVTDKSLNDFFAMKLEEEEKNE
jgi:hypothetical protein